MSTAVTCIIRSMEAPDKLSRANVRAWGRSVFIYASVNHLVFDTLETRIKIADIKKIYDLIIKYHTYQDEYEKDQASHLGNPQLLDAVLSGYNARQKSMCFLGEARSTFFQYDANIEADIKEIIRLTPESIRCSLGKLTYFALPGCNNDIQNMPPLLAACCNSRIPMHIVEYLFEKGAHFKGTVSLNTVEKTFEEAFGSLTLTRSPRETMKVLECFKKYTQTT